MILIDFYNQNDRMLDRALDTKNRTLESVQAAAQRANEKRYRGYNEQI